MIERVYFSLFYRYCKKPSRCLFHLMGALAFLLSAKKHFLRRNRKMLFDQLNCVFWQLKAAFQKT